LTYSFEESFELACFLLSQEFAEDKQWELFESRDDFLFGTEQYGFMIRQAWLLKNGTKLYSTRVNEK